MSAICIVILLGGAIWIAPRLIRTYAIWRASARLARNGGYRGADRD